MDASCKDTHTHFYTENNTHTHTRHQHSHNEAAGFVWENVLKIKNVLSLVTLKGKKKKKSRCRHSVHDVHTVRCLIKGINLTLRQQEVWYKHTHQQIHAHTVYSHSDKVTTLCDFSCWWVILPRKCLNSCSSQELFQRYCYLGDDRK